VLKNAKGKNAVLHNPIPMISFKFTHHYLLLFFHTGFILEARFLSLLQLIKHM